MRITSRRENPEIIDPITVGIRVCRIGVGASAESEWKGGLDDFPFAGHRYASVIKADARLIKPGRFPAKHWRQPDGWATEVVTRRHTPARPVAAQADRSPLIPCSTPISAT